MTQVTVRMQDALHGRVEIRGHAGDERICAAISTLTGAALNALGDAAENVVYESGDVEFDVRMTDGRQMGALETLLTGLEMLSENFSERVGVTVDAPVTVE